MQKQNIAVFDFCDTLVNFQTAFLFIDEIIANEKPNRKPWLRVAHSIFTRLKIYSVANKFWPSLNASKRVQLWFCRGISIQSFNSAAHTFFEQKIKPNYIPKVYQKMVDHAQQGDRIIISSGGYDPYLLLFCAEHSIDPLCCTRIQFKHGKATGYFEGADCMRGQKLKLLNQFILENNIQPNNTYCYSDSVSDLPILNWAQHAVVISKNKSQPWALENGFEEWIIES